MFQGFLKDGQAAGKLGPLLRNDVYSYTVGANLRHREREIGFEVKDGRAAYGKQGKRSKVAAT